MEQTIWIFWIIWLIAIIAQLVMVIKFFQMSSDIKDIKEMMKYDLRTKYPELQKNKETDAQVEDIIKDNPGKFTWQSWVALAILLIGILVFLFSGK